jgi:ribonuclease P protein component
MRLVRKAQYEAVYHCGERAGGRQGGRLRSAQFVAFYCANGGPASRFGISVKKAVGNAVVRNRIRRRIREILRRNYSEIPSGWDFVFHPRRSVANSDFSTLQTELLNLLRSAPPLRGSAENETKRDSSLRSE